MAADPLFSVTYLGPVLYFARLIRNKKVILEKHESWSKQTYRNRCYIDGPNGMLMLNIPVKHGGDKNIANIRISYTDQWHLKHWQAIQTTYGSSPFFEILAPELKEVYDREVTSLFELNVELTKLMLNWLQADVIVEYTSEWHPHENDMREVFHPKREAKQDFPEYPQVFDDKHKFLPNLSVIDLLFNEGPAAYDYLKNL